MCQNFDVIKQLAITLLTPNIVPLIFPLSLIISMRVFQKILGYFFHHQIIGSTVSNIFFRIYFDLTHVLIINVFRFQKRFQIEDSKNNKLLLAADVSEEE